MSGNEDREALFRRLRQALLERLEESGEQTDEEVQACIDALIREENARRSMPLRLREELFAVLIITYLQI